MTVEVLIIQQLCKVEETKSKALAGICKAPFYTVKVRDPLLALLVVRAATKVQTCSYAKERKKLIRKWKGNRWWGTTAALMLQVKNCSITSHILLSPETLILSFSTNARSDGSSRYSPFPCFCSEKQKYVFIFYFYYNFNVDWLTNTGKTATVTELYPNTPFPGFTYIQEILVKFTESNEQAGFSQGLHREQRVNIQILVIQRISQAVLLSLQW